MNENQTYNQTGSNADNSQFKFCQHCGKQIMKAAVICPHCGCQVEELRKTEQPNIIINNTNTNNNSNVLRGVHGALPKNKWVSFFLCLFFGVIGAHKFYEGRIGMGILYLLTGGLFTIGWFIDLIAILFKPNPYYV